MTITLTPTAYQIVPEGIHTFRIKSALYEDKFGRVTILCETKEGLTIQDKYTLINPTTRQPNEGAMKAFSYMCRVALQDWSVADIDPNVLVGRFIAARVEHTQSESRTKIGEMLTFANLGDKWSCDGFDDYSKVKDRDGNPIPLDSKPTPKVAPAPAFAPTATAPTAPAPAEPIPQSANPTAAPLPLGNPTPAPAPIESSAPKSPFDLAALFGR